MPVHYCSNQQIIIHTKSAKGKIKAVHIRTLADEQLLRYREWINKNRAYVHQKTKGKESWLCTRA